MRGRGGEEVLLGGAGWRGVLGIGVVSVKKNGGRQDFLPGAPEDLTPALLTKLPSKVNLNIFRVVSIVYRSILCQESRVVLLAGFIPDLVFAAQGCVNGDQSSGDQTCRITFSGFKLYFELGTSSSLSAAKVAECSALSFWNSDARL